MSGAGTSLKERIKQPQLICAPAIFNALTALMAERAGFPAGYVGGTIVGFMRAVMECSLTPHDFADIGTEIRTVTQFPLIVDAGVGWGDPMHMRRNFRLIEAAGYSAVEIEDQVAPKRAHHHAGIDRLVPIEVMVARIEQAVRARVNDDVLIIARTNATAIDMDDARRRCDAYARAGADMLFPVTGVPELVAKIGEGSPLPMAQMVYPGFSFNQMGLSHDELIRCNYRILIDGITPFTAAFNALESCYGSLASSPPDGDLVLKSMQDGNDLSGLHDLLEIEKNTTERDAPAHASHH